MAARPPWDAATDTIILVLLAVLAAVSSLPWLADAERPITDYSPLSALGCGLHVMHRFPGSGGGSLGAELVVELSTLALLLQLNQDPDRLPAHHNQHRPHRTLSGAAPLKPLPEPVDLDLYRIRRRAQVGGLINEYRLVA
jgi:hypothetical protein